MNENNSFAAWVSGLGLALSIVVLAMVLWAYQSNGGTVSQQQSLWLGYGSGAAILLGVVGLLYWKTNKAKWLVVLALLLVVLTWVVPMLLYGV